ncbi:MAG: hypothetical protein WBV64_12945 [Mycobacterium sp.]
MDNAITGLALATALLAACAAPHEPRALTIDRMVAISDGDHAASTYVDGMLAPQDAGYRDVLTTMSVIDGEVSTAQVEVTNSVTSAPEILALTPDGGTAFVAERLAARQCALASRRRTRPCYQHRHPGAAIFRPRSPRSGCPANGPRCPSSNSEPPATGSAHHVVGG